MKRENASTRPVAVPGIAGDDLHHDARGQGSARVVAARADLGRREEDVRSLQYMFRQDGAGYILTYSTLPPLATKYAPTFEKSAQSFEVN